MHLENAYRWPYRWPFGRECDRLCILHRVVSYMCNNQAFVRLLTLSVESILRSNLGVPAVKRRLYNRCQHINNALLGKY